MMDDRLWQIKEYPFKPDQHLYYETIFTIGNGYLGTRAAFEEGWPEDTPATLVHGIFDHAPDMLVPELVNAPNWLPIKILVDGTPFSMKRTADNLLNPTGGMMLGYQRTLHMDTGTLVRQVLFRAESGSTVQVTFERFASLDDVHMLAQRVTVTAVDGMPEITLMAALDGDVNNNGVRHWKNIAPAQREGGVTLTATTLEDKYTIALASVLVAPGGIRHTVEGQQATMTTSAKLNADESVTFDKLTAIYTSRDTENPLQAAWEKVQQAQTTGYSALHNAHRARWKTYWDALDVRIEGDEAAQVALRFTTYHIAIAAPQHDDDVSIGAKTLSGLGYKGHIFWDTELFMLPPFTVTIPEIARNMLMYRHKRLEGARQKARDNGYEGAMFPWESTDTGLETTPKWSDVLDKTGNPIRIWTGDNEQHISTDIAYAVMQYWRWTGDDEFLSQHGAEIVLDTAVFWGSRVQEINGRFELHDQIGPDEYHENINNSVFVNRMVVWHLENALQLVDWLKSNHPAAAQRLIQQLDLTDSRLAHWQDVVNRMYLPFDEEKQIHIQFDGFFDLEYIPVPHYEPRVGGIWGFLGHERALQSQVIKQADVVMLMALLGDQVGPRDVLLNNWNTYYPRSDHGSSLSPAMHAWVAAWLGLAEEAYHMFEHAAAIDLQDNKGNVMDGIHGAASGGLWQAVVFGFCGLHLTENGPQLDPALPAHWKSVHFNIVYRGEKHAFNVENTTAQRP